ncbi:Tumor necrosis factor [Dissostichus eleginoides]|uniref:Tumor necrosis factor n=1 Tax=Dissostichus eleginoides TaxID=100907 RepID=A0AAD9EVV0_DISEL|nr:Tumor necrosis factor [Dissostichus eleginoides]
MEGECKVMLEATVEPGSRSQLVKPWSKLTTALMVFTLCLASTAAAVLLFNMQSKGPGQDENTFDLRHTLRQLAVEKAAIHLVGHHNPSRKNAIEWKDDGDQTHSQGGLKLKRNEIVIPRPGLYFVYSQASFHVNCLSSDAEEGLPQPLVHLSHIVQRCSDTFGKDDEDSYQTILHSLRTACQMKQSSDPDEEGLWYSTVNVGAVFNLSRGDRLRTLTEEKTLPGLEDGNGDTFFGVFQL